MGRLQNEKTIEKSPCSLVVPTVCGGGGLTAGFRGSDRVPLAIVNFSKWLNIRATYQRPRIGRTWVLMSLAKTERWCFHQTYSRLYGKGLHIKCRLFIFLEKSDDRQLWTKYSRLHPTPCNPFNVVWGPLSSPLYPPLRSNLPTLGLALNTSPHSACSTFSLFCGNVFPKWKMKNGARRRCFC